ncbi:MAG: CotH kinase family protein [Muribaculaceae bacterium]|nr:CotH kinase family protein [Muribaculaceae bacterium]
MNNRFIILAILFFSFLLSFGQSFNFTTTIRDNNGNILKNQPIKIRSSIIKDDANGTITYIEECASTTNNYGVASIAIGKGAAISGDFSSVDWASKLFLKSEVDINNDGNFSIVNTTEIPSAPKSLYSNSTSKLVLTADDGNKWNVNVDNNGNITTTPTENFSTPEYGTVDYIFDMNALPTITLEISTDEWNKMLLNFDKNKENEECIVVDFLFNKYGEIRKVENVGLRLRGNTSRVRPEGSNGELHNSTNPNWHHCHYGFRFEKFQDNNLFSGTDRFSLRWFKEDATYAREIYCYDLMRRFGVWTTPKSSYCRLQIKIKEDSETAYMGVYEMFEGLDDQYLDDRVALGKINQSSGFLWKMGWGNGVGAYLTKDQANETMMGIEDIQLEGTSYKFSYDYKSKKKKLPEARTQFIEFINNLNDKTGEDFIQWAEQNINIDLLLRACAVTVAVGQWDDYWCNGNNFYLYFDTDKKCHYVPYDFDNSLGTSTSGLMDNPGTGNPLSWGNSNRPLITKILSVDKWKNQYIEYLKQLASADNDYLDADKSIARILKWQGMVEKYVDNVTGEDTQIIDRSASWSSGVKNYKLLTGNSEGGNNGDPNFFKTRIKTINSLLGK